MIYFWGSGGGGFSGKVETKCDILEAPDLNVIVAHMTRKIWKTSGNPGGPIQDMPPRPPPPVQSKKSYRFSYSERMST